MFTFLHLSPFVLLRSVFRCADSFLHLFKSDEPRDFFFFNSVIFFRSRIFVLFTISTSVLYSDFVHILFSWFLLLCCLSFHLSLKVRTVILKSFSSKAYAYVLQRWFLEIYFVLWEGLCFPVSLDVLRVFVENWPFEKSVTSPSLCKLVWKTFTN